ncbi:PLP-dependent transferase [Pleomassaria siparia CBS 279.74]|uniref:PLP-dependent transferase n=1 Tax=Pleomassaria siparia CBS 279.74 TaxID=1314801 RepID=A0A6G1K9I7_9PLEO|nr:PLP-dependent transferase [Pleomassaria siparia CBS 279.74]
MVSSIQTRRHMESHVKSGYANMADALGAARARFIERNVTSKRLHEESVKSLPGGNTRSLLHTAPFPIFLKSGKGYEIDDEDGHTYTDFVGEMTAALYGHSHPLIQNALINTVRHVGLNLGGTTLHEARHASLLCSRYNLSKIRFTNLGTEANLHALLGAKRFTGKSKVVVFTGAYHGACFMFPEDNPADNVIDKEDWIVAEYNSVDDAQKKIEESEDVAAVLVEGMQGGGPCIVGSHEFLHQIQASAKKVGAVFILDEVMTSRLAPGGLQALEGLSPDLTSMGKYLGGGMSFGAFGGREDIMAVYDPRDEKALAHSGTFNNNALSMVAGYTGLKEVYTSEAARERLQEVSQGTKMAVTGRGTILGIHFLEDGRKEIRSYRDKKDVSALRELFWYDMLEQRFWLTRRISIALILGTPWEEMERFCGAVEGFLTRHENLVKL